MLSESERAKRSGVVSINGVTYAVGLMWEPADDPDHAMKEAYSVAKSEGVEADFLCLRLSTPPQYGLGWKSVGHFSGVRPLAVAVTENVGGNYIGVFKIADKWWFGMSKNDIILPYGDAFYTSEEEAKDMMNKIISEVSSDTIKFAPVSWGIAGARDSSLDVLITNQTKVKLSPTDSLISRGKNVIMAAIVLIVGGYMIFDYISDKMEAEKSLRDQRRRQIEDARSYIDPWIKAPNSSDFLRACADGFATLPLDLYGWKIVESDCDGYTIKAPVRKSVGYIYDIENKSKDAGFNLVLDGEGITALISKPVRTLNPRSTYKNGTDLWGGTAISQQFLDLGNKIGVKVDISGVSQTPAQPRAMTDENGDSVTLPPIYTPINFSFSTKYPLESWMGYLSTFPGLSVSSLQVKLGSSISWTISGSVYQK